MHTRRLAKLAAMALIALALGACSKPIFLRGDLREEASEAADTYSTNLRWGKLSAAAEFVEPMRRSEFLAFFADGHRYRFTDISVDAIDYDRRTLSASAVVRFTLYTMPMVREIAITDAQDWRFDRDADTWYVDPNLETFRMLR